MDRTRLYILIQDVIFQNEKSSRDPDVSSTDIQNSDMEIVKKPLQTPDPDVEKEIEEISCSAENREETLAEQSSRKLRDRSILKMPAKFENFVLLAEHIEPETYKEVIASENSDKWLAVMKEELEPFVFTCNNYRRRQSGGATCSFGRKILPSSQGRLGLR
ncbi:retrovirus-related Pol polyprotein from transposon TNT 1-94 [Trichonephila clavipes]|nr:retrovirus-related Pol polyprotein from transposon TNT 1-94 [Trichonephila clavipes]